MINEKNFDVDYQTLNKHGQAAVCGIIATQCKEGVNAVAFFDDAEQARNDGRDDFEIGGQYTDDGRPVSVGLRDEWFAR